MAKMTHGGSGDGTPGDGERDGAGNQVDEGRRGFLKGALAAGGAAASFAAAGLSSVTSAQAQPGPVPGTKNHYYVPATDKTVHWGYFSKLLKPQVEVSSGDFVTIEALTHHANDDAERMVKGDAGAESVFYWDKQRKGVDRRGAGPMTPTLFGRGAGEGLGVHICTGPVAVREAEPGDILEVRIIDVKPRPCANPSVQGQELREQRRRLVGLPLQGPPDRAQAARGHHDLRGRRERRAQLGEGRLQLPLDAADGSLRCRPQDHRLPRRPGRPSHGAGEPGHPQEHPRAHPAAFRRARPGARRSRHGRLHSAQLHRRQHRRLAHRQGRHDVLPGRGEGRAALRRRLARLAGRLRALRHRHRVLAHRHLPAHRAQARQPGGHRAGRAQLSAAGDPGRVGPARVQLRELPGGARPDCAESTSTANLRSIWRCAMRSRRCGISS